MQTTRSNPQTDRRPSTSRGQSRANSRQARRLPPWLIAIAVVVLAAILFAGSVCSQAAPISVTVNGTHYTLRGDKTLQVALKESGLPVNPGDLISLQGNVLQRSAGYPFHAVVNGEETVDPSLKLHEGDDITLSDGDDMVEEYDAVEEPVAFGLDSKGYGAIHTFTPGADGVKEIRTGKLSGEVVEKTTTEPTDMVESCRDPAVGKDKVVALTFDGGPSPYYTGDILDVLSANDARATFFCLGSAVVDNPELVQRAAEEGHQVSSHTYSDALRGGGNMAEITAEEQLEEVESGLAAIEEALGYLPNRQLRFPGEREGVSDWVALNVGDSIDAEVSWTIDTGDWVYMAEDDIYDVLMSVSPGDIVRLHDGGDHQDATVGALKRALPKLKKQGFTFVTVDEMFPYLP